MIGLLFDSITSPSWVGVWFSVEFVSIVVIFIGCAGEAIAEHHTFAPKLKKSLNSDRLEHKETSEQRKTWWKRLFAYLVAAGLAIEMIAFGLSYLASNKEILELQAKLQPRTLSQKQVNDFIFLTESLPKVPVRVAVGTASAEAENYAWQIRDMLSAAKFPIPVSDTNQFLGVDWIFEAITLPTPRNKPLVDVQFMSGQGNNYDVFNYLREEHTNGFARYDISASTPENVYGALRNYFNQIGITTAGGYAPWGVTNICTIYINPKVQ